MPIVNCLQYPVLITQADGNTLQIDPTPDKLRPIFRVERVHVRIPDFAGVECNAGGYEVYLPAEVQGTVYLTNQSLAWIAWESGRYDVVHGFDTELQFDPDGIAKAYYTVKGGLVFHHLAPEAQRLSHNQAENEVQAFWEAVKFIR